VNTLTKLALGMLGQLNPRPATGEAEPVMALPAPSRDGGLPLMRALDLRQSRREFRPDALAPQILSDLLWAACGVNRRELGGRTAPSAMNAQEIDLYLATAEGLWLFEPVPHQLRRVQASDVRRVTGYQDFVDEAPLDLVMVADHARMKMVPASKRESYASVAAGAIAQNVYLFCASAGLATVSRAWFDRAALTRAIGLGPDQQIVLTQTVGRPKG
jgi:nitroreductase